MPPNATTVYTKHDDIAHFTCTVRLQATISWKRERRDVTNDDLGIAILSLKNGGSLESHLFVAVTADDLRGKYECFSSDDPDVAMQTFLIKSKIYCMLSNNKVSSHYVELLYSRSQPTAIFFHSLVLSPLVFSKIS